MTQHVRWGAAIAAGMVAGILATVVQVALWFALTEQQQRQVKELLLKTLQTFVESSPTLSES